MDETCVGALNRRQFIGAGAAISASIFSSMSLHAKECRDENFGSFTVGAQSYCFRNFSVEQAIKRAHDLGLRHMEFYPGHVPLSSTAAQLNALQKLCKDYDVTPIAYGVQGFSKEHAGNKKVFDFAKAFDVKYLSADPSPDSFESLDKLVDEYKIAIAIHPHGPSGGGMLHRWYSAEAIMAAVKDHHPLIGSCLDTGHLIRADQLGKKLDPAQQVRAMGDRNFGMHLKDHDNRTKRDVIYGKGVLDVPAVLKALKDVKFKGYISIEYEANPEDPSNDIKACIDILKASIKAQS